MDLFWIILFLHLLGAAIWAGGHLVLSLAILPRALKAGDLALLQDYAMGYMRIAMPALALQAITGLWLALQVVPDWRDWLSFSDPQTTSIGVKLVLLAVTVGLIVSRRLRGHAHHGPDALTGMARHLRAMTVVAVLFLAAGALLRTGGF